MRRSRKRRRIAAWLLAMLLVVSSGMEGGLLQLWVSTTSGVHTMKPLATATLTVVKFKADFGQTYKTIVLGDEWIVKGNVSIEGGCLGKVTVNAYATVNSNLTEDFSALSVTSVDLQNWAAFTIDTTQEPFNKAGIYTLHIWAKDVDGVGGSHSLAQRSIGFPLPMTTSRSFRTFPLRSPKAR